MAHCVNLRLRLEALQVAFRNDGLTSLMRAPTRSCLIADIARLSVKHSDRLIVVVFRVPTTCLTTVLVILEFTTDIVAHAFA